jgi:hypothetical protein
VTLQQLDTTLFSGGMLHTTSLKLTSLGAAIEPCETDLVVLTREFPRDRPHQPQVLVGECKSAGGEITVVDAEHLGKVADVRHP